MGNTFQSLAQTEEARRRTLLIAQKEREQNSYRAYNMVRQMIRECRFLSIETLQAYVACYCETYADDNRLNTSRREWLGDYLRDEIALRNNPQFDEMTPKLVMNGEVLFIEAGDMERRVAADESFVSKEVRYTHAKTGQVYTVRCVAWESEGRVYNRAFVNQTLISAFDYTMTPNHAIWMANSEAGLRAALDTAESYVWRQVGAMPF